MASMKPNALDTKVRELPERLVDAVVDSFSRVGQFNNYTAPMGTIELRELAMQLRRALVQTARPEPASR
jgi:hypothetical protein